MKHAFKLTALLMLLIQLYSLVNSQAPTSGCDAISEGGRCYKYLTHTGIVWSDARQLCLAWGGDLATFTSLEEFDLMYSTITDSPFCWLGYNDIENEGTWVWADGNNSTFTNWDYGEPNNGGGNQDCGWTWSNQKVYDAWCGHLASCSFCSTIVSPFGRQTGAGTFSALGDNPFLIRDTTLYCLTENQNNPQVTWTFINADGHITFLSATTDATTGVSSLNVTNDRPGYYKCEVTQNGGDTRTYTTVMLTPDSPVLTLDYGCANTFTLLPPAVNRADIPILTENVKLSTNLVGRWQTPDGSYVDSDSLTIPTLYVSHAGLYKFWVANWDGDWTLAIQINISPVGNSFGRMTSTNTFKPLSKDSILTSDTTLYCLTDSINGTVVVWSYEDASGIRNVLSGTTDASTGISTLSVSTDVPGYYSCDVSKEGGVKMIYTVEILDVSLYTVATDTKSYEYTIGIVREDIFLFCPSPDSSVQLSDIHWRRQDRNGFYLNPLDLHRLGYLLKYSNTQPMECFDKESDSSILNVKLNIQGPPIITLYNSTYTTFSLLPSAVNRADIPILTENVKLSTNLVGRWQTPDDSYVDSDSLTIPTLYVSHAGLYKFYVTNWDGDRTLAIQIYISPVETYTQTITDLTTETSSKTSIQVEWSLSETNSYDSQGLFSVYLIFGRYENLAGTTKDKFFEIQELVLHGNYTVRVDLKYPYSALIISATTHHLLALNGDTIAPDVGALGNTDIQPTSSCNTTVFPTDTQPSISYTMYTFIAVLVILAAILILVLLICVFIVCAMKIRTKRKANPCNDRTQFPQAHTNEIYPQVDNTPAMFHNNKMFLSTGSVEVSKQASIELDQKSPIPDSDHARYSMK